MASLVLSFGLCDLLSTHRVSRLGLSIASTRMKRPSETQLKRSARDATRLFTAENMEEPPAGMVGSCRTKAANCAASSLLNIACVRVCVGRSDERLDNEDLHCPHSRAA